MKRSSATPDLNNDLLAWRRKSLGLLLWVVLSVRAAQFLVRWADGYLGGIPAGLRLAHLGLLVLLLALAVLRDLPHGLRGWVLIGLGYLNLVTAFTATGRFDGPIPLAMLVLPIYAAIFLGGRAAWAAAGLGASLFGGMALASWLGMTRLHGSPAPNPGPFSTIFGWLVVFLPVMFVLDRFTALLQRVASREKAQRLQIQFEAGERRFLEGALLETAERERQALGHELHDGICQQITGALLQCRAAEQAATLGGAPESASLRKISSILGDSLGQVHDLARGLSPGVLTPEALLPSLLDLARRTRETFEVACDLEARDCPALLDPAAATHLYRIAQEALINAVKHGRPGRILIRLTREGGALVLEVSNDGQPLVDPGPERRGMGLRIMRYRSELLGGIFELAAGPGPGARVRCAVPMATMACRADA